ncbi:MAG: hypothetical protein QW483_02835, partial [Nanopusillaceae archaeon]
MFDLISTILLLLIPIDALIRLIKKDEKKVKKYFSYFFLVLGINLTLKLIFRIERNYIDPFAFPSTHSSLSIIPFFVYDNLKYKILFLIYAIVIGSFRIFAEVHDLYQVLFGYLFSLVSIIIFNKLEEKLENFIHRKAIHIGLGSLIGYLLFLYPLLGILFMILLLLIGIILYLLKDFFFIKLFLQNYSKDSTGYEAFTFVLGTFSASLISYALNINPYFIPIYLAWVDGLSSTFGKLFNSGDKKSIYGLFGGFIGGIISVLATRTNPIIAIVVSISEYFIRKIDDNLILPIITFLM